jgi:flagellar FliL protein
MAGKKKAEVETPLPALDGDPEIPPADGGAKPARFGKKQKIIAGGVAGLLLIGGGGGAYFMMSGSGEKHEKAETEKKAEPVEEEAEAEGEEGKGGELPLVDVPAMIVNLRTSDGNARYLKLHFMIEARSAAKVEPLKAKLPAIIDAYQPFLRELRPEDLNGSAAVFRIKEEMLVRATAAVGAGMVKDILIQDLVQQ